MNIWLFFLLHDILENNDVLAILTPFWPSERRFGHQNAVLVISQCIWCVCAQSLIKTSRPISSALLLTFILIYNIQCSDFVTIIYNIHSVTKVNVNKDYVVRLGLCVGVQFFYNPGIDKYTLAHSDLIVFFLFHVSPITPVTYLCLKPIKSYFGQLRYLT